MVNATRDARLFDLIKKTGLTVKSFCKLCGISTCTVYKALKKPDSLGEDSRFKITSAIGPNYLMSEVTLRLLNKARENK